MSQISYGGVVLELARTNLYQHIPVMSEDGTELLYIRTVIDVTTVYNGRATSYAGTGGAFASVDGATPGRTDVAIRLRLLTPRLAFAFKSADGTVILAAPADGYDCDLESGPRPLSCTVTDMGAETKTWRVHWRVQVATKDCSGAGGDYPILSNRWSQTSETGLDRLTRLTTAGLTVFRQDVLQKVNATADFYRDQCIPKCPIGFQRQYIRATLDPAGTHLVWQAVDQEVFVYVGDTTDPTRLGVEHFRATYSMRSSAPNPENLPTDFSIAEFTGTAWGSKASNNGDLLKWLCKLAIERCALPTMAVAQPETQPQILGVQVRVEIDHPEVGYSVSVRYPPAKELKPGLGTLRVEFLGVDLLRTFANNNLSPQMPNAGNTRGYSPVNLFAAALKAACDRVPALPAAINLIDDDEEAATYEEPIPPAVEVEVSEELPDYAESSYHEDIQTRGACTEYRLQMRYTTSTGKVQAPLAGPVQLASPGDGTQSPPGTHSPAPGVTNDDETGTGTGSSTPTPGCVVLTLTRPTTRLVVTFEAERSLYPPALPNPNSTDKNLVLLEEDLSPMHVGVAGDGVGPVYRIGGVYTYAMKVARTPGDPLKLPVAPWSDFVFGDDEVVLPAPSFVNGIIDPEEEEGDDPGEPDPGEPDPGEPDPEEPDPEASGTGGGS